MEWAVTTPFAAAFLTSTLSEYAANDWFKLETDQKETPAKVVNNKRINITIDPIFFDSERWDKTEISELIVLNISLQNELWALQSLWLNLHSMGSFTLTCFPSILADSSRHDLAATAVWISPSTDLPNISSKLPPEDGNVANRNEMAKIELRQTEMLMTKGNFSPAENSPPKSLCLNRNSLV